jgi:PP-loop superfamily ATP-utilizing enzyme
MREPDWHIIRKIEALRLKAMTADAIAAELGITRQQVNGYAHRHNLARKHRSKRPHVSRRIGKFGLEQSLTVEQLQYLDAKAEQYGCETITEAAIEELRDLIDAAISRDTCAKRREGV